MSSYKATYEQDPTAIEAVAFDAASILEQVLASEKPKDRTDLKNELQDVKNFKGVTGKITYRDGLFSRVLTFLTVKDGQIVQIK